MNIVDINKMSESDMLSSFSQTRLRGHGQPLVYENARLELVRQVDPATLVPAQRYILKEDHQRLQDLHDQFQERNIDIFNLEGGLFFRLKGSMEEEHPIPLMPPVVEMSLERNGQIVPLINDGMHRIYTAMKLGKKINIILVHDVPSEYPYYAFALENGWDDVEELEVIMRDYVKKEYRDKQDHRALFRDFNAVFNGIQKKRAGI